MDGKLTKEQIENWRKVLYLQVGPAAFFMTDSQIQAYRDRMQAVVNELPKEEVKEDAKASFGIMEPQDKPAEPFKLSIGEILKAQGVDLKKWEKKND